MIDVTTIAPIILSTEVTNTIIPIRDINTITTIPTTIIMRELPVSIFIIGHEKKEGGTPPPSFYCLTLRKFEVLYHYFLALSFSEPPHKLLIDLLKTYSFFQVPRFAHLKVVSFLQIS